MPDRISRAGSESGWFDGLPKAIGRAALASEHQVGLRVAQALARALGGPHGESVAHGGLRLDAIVLEDAGPTLLVAGRGVPGRAPADDLRDALALVRALGEEAPGVSDMIALAAWAEPLLRRRH